MSATGKNMKLYTAIGAAAALGYAPSTIHAMKKGYVDPETGLFVAGVKFSHGLRTDLRTIMNWIKANPRFRTRMAYARRGRRSASTSRIPGDETADRSDAPLLMHG